MESQKKIMKNQKQNKPNTNSIVIPTIWNNDTYSIFQKSLFTKKEEQFLAFNQKLIFSSYEMIGIRTPILKNIVKEIKKTDYISFLNVMQFQYYEEILLEGFLIAHIDDKDVFLSYFKKFLTHIDNWAVCDMGIASMKIFSYYQKEFFPFVKKLLKSKEEFIVRAGIVILMNYYLEEEWLDKIFSLLNSIITDQYYVQMAIAWLLSISYIKFKKKTLIYLKENSLDTFTHNKAIQKIRESTVVSKEEKEQILMLKK